MKELINLNKWQEVLTPEEYKEFTKLVMKLIASSTDRGHNYSDIMLAFYNIIRMTAYEYEVETIL